MKTLSPIVLALTTLVLVGCQQSEPQAATPEAAPAAQASIAPTAGAPMSGRIAVFDIDYIGDQTGMVQSMQKKMADKKAELQKELEEFGKKLQETLQEEGKKLKKDKDLPKKARALEQATQMRYRQVQAEADAALNGYRMKLIGEIRDAIKPVAKEVAYGKGFNIIMLRNDTVVFDAKDEVDLTADILTAYRAKHPDAVKKPEPEAKTERAPAKAKPKEQAKEQTKEPAKDKPKQ